MSTYISDGERAVIMSLDDDRPGWILSPSWTPETQWVGSKTEAVREAFALLRARKALVAEVRRRVIAVVGHGANPDLINRLTEEFSK